MLIECVYMDILILIILNKLEQCMCGHFSEGKVINDLNIHNRNDTVFSQITQSLPIM